MPNQHMNGMSMHIYLCIPPIFVFLCRAMSVSLFQDHMTKGLKRISGKNLKEIWRDSGVVVKFMN